ncbi:MAG TPA: tyrosine-type recombinase/integrase [Puia sp.]
MAKRTANFILNEPQLNVSLKAQKTTTILLTYSCQDGRLKYSTKQSILPKDWNYDEHEAKATCENHVEINDKLNVLNNYIEDFFEQFPRHERQYKRSTVTEGELRYWLDVKTNRIKKQKKEEAPAVENKITFFEAVRNLISDAKSGKEVHGKYATKYSEGAIKNWEKTFRILEEFDPNLSFDIDKETYEAFKLFCNNKVNPKTEKKGYAANYVGSLIKDWKTFMEKTRQHHNNTFYRSREFFKLSEEIDLPYLNDDEIETLIKCDKLSKLQQEIRDRYVINLFTGLRVSDMEKLNEAHIENDKIIIQNNKTGKIVAIPVAEQVKDIIAKYNGQLPKQYHRNIVNRELKEIGLLAELRRPVQFTRMVGGKKIVVSGKLYQFLSNHTARRSHATNLLKETDFLTAKQILGMTIKTMELYNKRSAEENADMAKSLHIYSRKKVSL